MGGWQVGLGWLYDCKINAVEHFSFLFEGLIKAVKRVLTIIILLFEIYNYPERDHWERSQIDLRLISDYKSQIINLRLYYKTGR